MSTSLELRRPPLPRELLRPSVWKSSLFCLYAVVLFVGPAFAAWKVAHLSEPLWIRILAITPLVLLAQQGLHLTGWVGHEGLHFTLFRNRYASGFVGTLLSSMFATLLFVGAAVSHWTHHRYTNQSSDPHRYIYTRFRSFWPRVLLSRLAANSTFRRDAFKMALGRPLPKEYRLPYGRRLSAGLAWFNIGCSLGFTSLYVYIAILDPVAGLVSIAIPHLLAYLQSGARVYVEHAGTRPGKFVDSRTMSHPLWTALYFGNNYHLEHHLYPGVPCYHLPRVHRWLAERGFYERASSPIDPGVSGALLYARRAFGYPEGEVGDGEHNPFDGQGTPARAA